MSSPAAAPRRPRPLAAVLAAVGIPIFMVTLDNLVVTTRLSSVTMKTGMPTAASTAARGRCRTAGSAGRSGARVLMLRS